MAFIPRFVAPNETIKYYRHTGYYVSGENGVNECLLINASNGAIMPNCVGYTWGRAYEVYDVRPTLSRGDARGWYDYNDGYPRIDTPLVGCVVCWWGGNYGGHVGFIEAKNSSTEYITSNSYYNSRYFTLEYMRYVDGKWCRYRYADDVLISNYTFKTVIKLTDEPDPPTPPVPPTPTPEPILGNKLKLIMATKPLPF